MRRSWCSVRRGTVELLTCAPQRLRANRSKLSAAQTLASEHVRIRCDPAASLTNRCVAQTRHPLNNRHVIVTAPRQYASKLCGLLVERGARPVWLPSIEIASLEDPEQLRTLDARLAQLHDYTHLAFTSKNGINAVLERLQMVHGDDVGSYLQQSGIRVCHKPFLEVCALGADSETLVAAGIPVHVLPEESSTQGMVKELVRRGEASGARVLCPVPHVAAGLIEPPVVPRFLAALDAAGAASTRIDAYLTRPFISAQDIQAEVSLLKAGFVSAIIFTSQAEAQGLVHALGGQQATRNLLTSADVVLAAHGPYTAAGVKSIIALELNVVGQQYRSFHGVVNALEEHFRKLGS